MRTSSTYKLLYAFTINSTFLDDAERQLLEFVRPFRARDCDGIRCVKTTMFQRCQKTEDSSCAESLRDWTGLSRRFRAISSHQF